LRQSRSNIVDSQISIPHDLLLGRNGEKETIFSSRVHDVDILRLEFIFMKINIQKIKKEKYINSLSLSLS